MNTLHSYARILTGPDRNPLPPERWQPLEDHLLAVAEAARASAAKFDAAGWGWLAGLWHDLGKYHPEFQQLLLDASRGRHKRLVDHSSAGAIQADRCVGRLLNRNKRSRLAQVSLLLTATIAGHHAGLPECPADLEDRLANQAARFQEIARLIDFLRAPGVPVPPPLPARLRVHDDGEGHIAPDEWRVRLDLLIRMLFSALVDADRSDARRADRLSASASDGGEPPPYSSIAGLCRVIDRAIDEKVAGLHPDRMTPLERRVYEYRQEVLRACRTAADLAPGAFSLDVATGGGKTLSSLSFALRHAVQHQKDRVIVVIPFTSIIEQTAAEYRKALGDLAYNVIEHHSAVNENFERDELVHSPDSDADRRRLATENWDAPIILTTAVQFFESLLASTPSKCRKLHNVASAVVVMDEAQALPPTLLEPTVWLINELVEAYGVTVVLSTATQPSLERPFPEIRALRPIMPSEVTLPPRRVRSEVVGDGPLQWDALATYLAQHQQVLCITHKRRDARDLSSALDRFLSDQTTVHLSASMCAAHRSTTIAEVRRRLAEGKMCRVVSTQLVEAGVDLDFPVVYRAMAGIDSLVQAAGRANREGRLGECGGLLRVYEAPTEPPSGLPRLAAGSAQTMFRQALIQDQNVDVFDQNVARAFFHDYFAKIGDMDQGIRSDRVEFRFRSVADKYRFIDDASISVVVPWHEAVEETLEDMRRLGPSSARLRRLQIYIVHVFARHLEALVQAGAVIPLLDDRNGKSSLYALLRLEPCYTARFGLDVGDVGPPAAADFVI